MPGQTLLVEGNDDLWALVIGFLCKHKVCLIRVLPVVGHQRKFALSGQLHKVIHHPALNQLQTENHIKFLNTLVCHSFLHQIHLGQLKQNLTPVYKDVWK